MQKAPIVPFQEDTIIMQSNTPPTSPTANPTANPTATPTATPSAKINPIVIKKYANRRLYNTDTSSYVTLDDLCKMIKDGEEVIVFDAKNGDDITRSVLTQIIVEQESKGGQSLLPTGFLRQIISSYGGSMQGIVPGYLDYMMQALTKNQGQMQDVLSKSFGSLFPFNTMQQMTKQNVALFEQTMRMFSPFAPTAGQGQAGQGQAGQGQAGQQTSAANPEPVSQNAAETQPQQATYSTSPHLRPVPNPAPEDDASFKIMQQRLDDLQKQIAVLSKKDE
jgi:polyhydroxyalkanoate synthesis repressor PhaR